MIVHGNYFIATYMKTETIYKRKINKQDLLLIYSTIAKLLLFLTVPILIETVSPV